MLSSDPKFYAQSLSRADSLYRDHRYLEAYPVYQEIEKKGYVSVRMLLSMAYIEESLGQVAEALRSLSKGYLLSYDPEIREKIESLLADHDIPKYDFSDMDPIFFLANTYRKQGLWVCGLIGFVLLSLLSYAKYKRKEHAIFSLFGGLSVIIVVWIVWWNQPWRDKSFAIVKQKQAWAKAKPASGASPIQTIPYGERVHILNSDSVWTEIQRPEKNLFIRTHALLTLSILSSS
ncbi:MAG: hypothetical protein OXB93_00185 [Cytophagales bacterium]|nr:hypothetical protein [Cytophagales bacterium]